MSRNGFLHLNGSRKYRSTTAGRKRKYSKELNSTVSYGTGKGWTRRENQIFLIPAR